jgi:hypothetical protein
MEWVYDNQQKEKRYFRLNGIGLIRLKALVYAQDKLSNKEGIMIIARCINTTNYHKELRIN